MELQETKEIILNLLNDINNLLDEIQKKFIQGAQQIGFTKQNFTNLTPFFKNIDPKSDETDIMQFFSAAKDYLYSYKNELQVQKEKTEDSLSRVQNSVASGVIFISSTSTAWNVIDHNAYNDSKSQLTIPVKIYNKNDFSERLNKLDVALCKTYNEIDEIIHGTLADPERAALYMLRQSFDHLFDVLAPDEKVRTSKYWKEKNSKESKDPNAVLRIEKINYAANTHVKDSARAQSLVDQSKLMLDAYNLLNKAHNRNEIDAVDAKNLIISMKTMLEEWVEALDL